MEDVIAAVIKEGRK